MEFLQRSHTDLRTADIREHAILPALSMRPGSYLAVKVTKVSVIESESPCIPCVFKAVVFAARQPATSP